MYSLTSSNHNALCKVCARFACAPGVWDTLFNQIRERLQRMSHAPNTREQCLAQRSAMVPGEKLEIPDKIKRKYCGCRVGVKRRAKKRRYKPYLPLVIMWNVRSLVNKMDELTALVSSQREYQECSETLLHGDIPETNETTITGFETIWADRN